MYVPFPHDTGTLITAAMILACMLAKDRPAVEISRMGAFFTLLGDTLALMALHPELLIEAENAQTQIPGSCD